MLHSPYFLTAATGSENYCRLTRGAERPLARHIKQEVKPPGTIQFRWPNGETRDAYAVIGTVDGLPGNNKHLLWIEMEQAAHPFGRARTCQSCHASESQLSLSTWEFRDDQGAEPFRGTHKIVADAGSLRFEDIKNTTPIALLSGSKLEDFASWIYLKDRWKVAGDFSIKTDKEKYRKSLSISQGIERELRILDTKARGLDKKMARRYSELKGAVLHDPEGGREIMDEWIVHLSGTGYNRKGVRK